MALADDMMANAKRLLAAGSPGKARGILTEVARTSPHHVDACLLLGYLDNEAGRFDEAERWLRLGIETKPNAAELHYNLGVTLSALGREADAERAFREAVRLSPSLAPAHYNLAGCLHSAGRLDEAVDSLREAIRHDPRIARAHYNLANGLRDQGRVRESLEAFKAAIALDPGSDAPRTNRLMALNYVTGDAAAVYAEHKRYGDSLIARAGPAKAHANVRNPNRRIRVGFLSADLRQHSCSYFLEPLLAGLDTDRFEIMCYLNHPREDDVSRRLRGLVAGWRSVWTVGVAEADRMIRADAIDVLIECSGHTDHSRLDIMAARPAPVQGTYLGYPNTTGLSTIDFRVVDSISDPSEGQSDGASDRLCVERLVRLDPCAWCFRPDASAPLPSPPPVDRNGFVTFGSFNNLSKVSDETVALWCRVLEAVPGSRLLMKNRWMGDPGTAHRLRERFAAASGGRVDPGRIDAAPFTPGVRDHLAMYERIDIQLDTYPYHGTTTTCESLWQGVPVVTLCGGVHAARVGASLLSCVGLPELAPSTPQGFVDAALKLAQSPAHLGALRSELRSVMSGSALMDQRRFADRFGAAVRAEFERWARGPIR